MDAARATTWPTKTPTHAQPNRQARNTGLLGAQRGISVKLPNAAAPSVRHISGMLAECRSELVRTAFGVSGHHFAIDCGR
jgi:hypothetical protein